MVPIPTVQYSITLPLILVKISDDSKDNYHYTYQSHNGSSSSSSNAGIIIAVVIVVLVKLGLLFMCYARRRGRAVGGRVVVVRRRVACSATVPIVENDELQREHEEAEREQLDYPPPLYTPTAEPLEGCTTNNGQNPYQTQEEEMVNAEEGPSVPQGSTREPPPPYSPNPAAISSESTNSTQTDPAQREEIKDNTEEAYGVSQGSTMVPPPEKA